MGTSPLLSCSPALALALEGGIPLWQADLFKFVLTDGLTTFYWTSWNKTLSATGHSWTSAQPAIKRSKRNVTNTMEVPSMQVYLMASDPVFNSGAALMTQITQGLLDGATFLLSRAYMDAPGSTTALGTMDLFGGEVAGIDLNETLATVTCKGKNFRLDQFAPGNMLQVDCNHAFCDAGCTLNRAAYTASYTMGATPTNMFIPWASAPGNATNYLGGTFAVTTGVAAGSRRQIVEADSTGLLLAYPLYITPSAGDGFTAFEGCDKAYDSGSGRDCTARANTQHHRGFEFVPDPLTSY